MASESIKSTMRRGGAIAVVAGLGAAVAIAVGGSDPAGAGTEHESFAFAIGNETLKGSDQALTDRYAGFDLVVVDGEEATPGDVQAIQAAGTTVLAYLSVGTIEKWRPWYKRLKRYRLSAWQDWKDEWFADTSKPALRRKLVRIADGMLAEGFDGLFLDNVDMVEVKKHRRQRRGMGQLVADLDDSVGAGLLFAQNGAGGVLGGYPAQAVEPLVEHLDGWNREDVTWTYDFDRRRYVESRPADRADALEELEAIAGEGLETTATDYVEIGDGFSAAECDAITNSVAVGALPYLANIGLTRAAVEANPPTGC